MKSQNKTFTHWRYPGWTLNLRMVRCLHKGDLWHCISTPNQHSAHTLCSSQQGAWSFCKWTICQEAVYIPSPAPLFNTLALKGKSFLISYGLSYFNQLTSGVQLWQPWQAKTGDVPTADFPPEKKKKERKRGDHWICNLEQFSEIDGFRIKV